MNALAMTWPEVAIYITFIAAVCIGWRFLLWAIHDNAPRPRIDPPKYTQQPHPKPKDGAA